MANLILMCGVPGSGKSTWAKQHLKPSDVYISRDEIRFSLVAENEEYFSKETEVFKLFIQKINEALKDESVNNVFVDATHISKASRNKILSNIKESVDEINCVWMKTNIAKTLMQNEQRKGTRAYVPKSVIKKLFEQFEKPVFEECFDVIYIVEDSKLTSMTMAKELYSAM